MASLGNFYLSTWEEYHTGILYLGYFSGPVEGVLMLVAVQLVSGYFGKCFSHVEWHHDSWLDAGPGFWMQRVSDVVPVVDWAGHPIRHRIGNVQLNHVLILIGAGVLVFNIIAA